MTVHLATEHLDKGDVVSAERLIPYFSEPYSLFKRRLGLLGASVLVSVIERWPNLEFIQQPVEIGSRFFRHSDKPPNLGNLTERIFLGKNIRRYTLIQRYGANILVLPYILSTQTTDPEKVHWPINRNELVEIDDKFLGLIICYSGLDLDRKSNGI